MLKKTIIALAFSSCFICMGQEKADVPQTPGDAEKEVVEVIDVNNTLQKIRAKSNLNKKGFTGISAADIGASPKTRQYVLNRSMAFAVAELNAKKIIAKSLQSSIATAMKNSSKINSDGLSADALGGDAELAKIVNEEIKKELLAKGVDIARYIATSRPSRSRDLSCSAKRAASINSARRVAISRRFRS